MSKFNLWVWYSQQCKFRIAAALIPYGIRYSAYKRTALAQGSHVLPRKVFYRMVQEFHGHIRNQLGVIS